MESSRVNAADPRFERSRAALIAAVSRLSEPDATVASVTRAARVHRTTFYNHFASVEELAAAAIADRLEQMRVADYADRHAGRPPAEVAIRTLSAIFDYLRANPGLTQLASAWTAPSGLAGVAELLRRQVRIFREEFGDPGAPDAGWEDIYVASGMFGMFTAALATRQPGGIDAMLRLLPGWMQQPRTPAPWAAEHEEE